MNPENLVSQFSSFHSEISYFTFYSASDGYQYHYLKHQNTTQEHANMLGDKRYTRKNISIYFI